MEASIQQYILNLPDKKQEITLAVRDIILAVEPEISEQIKWNQLTFSIGKYNMAFIYSYPDSDYCNLGFFDATSLSDPNNLFEGTGKRMRHIKIYKIDDIPEEQLKFWVQESILLRQAIGK